MIMRRILAVASAVLVVSAPAFARQCRDLPVPERVQAALFGYVAKNGTSEDAYTVAAMGNEHILLGTDLKPMSADALAAVIKGDPKFNSVDRVVLEWPYSSRGDAPFARELEALLGKPVIGYPGPVWWYADGTMIAARGGNGTEAGPEAMDVIGCAASDGALLEGAACQTVFATHRTQSKYFANAPYDLSCDQISRFEILSDEGDPKATLRLLQYHRFVNRDDDAEKRYLSRPH
ncbi:MAG: hypothetical protein AB7O49_09650 [Sphingomonadales bacterium]